MSIFKKSKTDSFIPLENGDVIVKAGKHLFLWELESETFYKLEKVAVTIDNGEGVID